MESSAALLELAERTDLSLWDVSRFHSCGNPKDSILFPRQTPGAALRGCPGRPTAGNVQFGGGDAGGQQPPPAAALGSAEESVM